jgi:hypothetical protein
LEGRVKGEDRKGEGWRVKLREEEIGKGYPA